MCMQYFTKTSNFNESDVALKNKGNVKVVRRLIIELNVSNEDSLKTTFIFSYNKWQLDNFDPKK